MSDTLLNVLENPALQAGLSIVTTANPVLGLSLKLVRSLLEGWATQSDLNEAIKIIDGMCAEHIKRLALVQLNPIERNEIEIRLHELLTVLVKLGGM